MPSPSPEVVFENLRRTLHGNAAHYAALSAEALRGDPADEVMELSLLLGLEWPGPAEAPAIARLGRLLDSLCDAARADQQATLERREAARRLEGSAEAVPPVTEAIDRWLERWLSGKEAGRLP